MLSFITLNAYDMAGKYLKSAAEQLREDEDLLHADWSGWQGCRPCIIITLRHRLLVGGSSEHSLLICIHSGSSLQFVTNVRPTAT